MCTICMLTQTFDPARHEGAEPVFDGALAGPLNAALTEGSDAAANTSTTYAMTVNDTFSGTIGTNTDVDWIAVTLTAGTNYTFDAFGDGNTSLDGYDTDLTLYDASGTQLAYNDASGAGFDAQLNYAVTTTGTYYIAVSSFNSTNATGSYTLAISEFELEDGTIEELAGFLKDGSTGTATEYTFNTTFSNEITVDISGLTADGQQLALWAMEAWEMVADIDFVVQTDGVQGNEMITVDDEDDGAFAYFPNTGSTSTSNTPPDNTNGVELNVAKSWLTNNGTTIDSYSFQTYVHEFGHALGLHHLGDYNGSASFPSDATFANDSWQMSVMSYFSQSENTSVNASEAFLGGAMMADIMAIQDFYGAPGSSGATAGDTTWGVGSNLGNYLDEAFLALSGGTPSVAFEGNAMAFTFYDQDGTDTIDFSFATVDDALDFNLNGGTFSDVGSFTGVVGIAVGTVIENFVAGAADDNVVGNAANNQIMGGDGDDSVTGGAGDDMLEGGSGSDTAIYNGDYADYAVLSYDGMVMVGDQTGTDGVDTLDAIETLTFDDQSVDVDTAATEFEAMRYIASHADLMAVFGADGQAGLEHYLKNGLSEGRQISFDAYAYVASHADLLAVFGTDTEAAAQHYIELGQAEGRGITFSGLEYIASYGDLMAVFGADGDAGLEHFVTLGAGEGREITFNGLEYVASHADLIGAFGANGEAGADHFITYGAAEGRETTFNGLEYIASHADLAAVFGTDAGAGALHYIQFGAAEGREITFDGLAYLTSHLDLLAVFGTDIGAATQHYIQFGLAEGRATDARADAGLDAITEILTGDTGIGGSSAAELLLATGDAGGATTLFGNGGDDILIGDAGANYLSGGTGDDQMLGGAGSDVFDFNDLSGNDTIYDFDVADAFEVINLGDVTEITDFDDLIANHAEDGAAGVVITYGDNSLTLVGVTESLLGADDFNFGSSGLA